MPKIAIIGRENVGKSTLFNRLTEEQLALVADYAGTTRDRNIATVLWRGQEMELIDTAGYDLKVDDKIKKGALKQFQIALHDADLILFVVDSHTGIIRGDRELANLVTNLNKPYILVANKADNYILRNDAVVFEKLGLGPATVISSVSGSGTGDLLDAILAKLPMREIDEEADKEIEETVETRFIASTEDGKKEKPIRIAFLGQPNVGKSSIINGILNEERVITSSQAYTTREPNRIPFTYKEKSFVLVDTAGIRKNLQSPMPLEEKSVEKSLDSLKHVDIIVLVLEANREINKQDIHLAGLADQAHKGLIIVVNKWDLIEDKTTTTILKKEKDLRSYFKFIKWVPFIFTAAIKKQRVRNILDTALEITKQRSKWLDNKEVQNLLLRALKRKPPPYLKNPKIKALEQVAINPPTFLIIAKRKEWIHFSYLRYIENQIRKKYGFMGTAIKFIKRKLK